MKRELKGQEMGLWNGCHSIGGKYTIIEWPEDIFQDVSQHSMVDFIKKTDWVYTV